MSFPVVYGPWTLQKRNKDVVDECVFIEAIKNYAIESYTPTVTSTTVNRVTEKPVIL